MADTFIGIDKGLDLTTVTDAASTTSKTIELRINDTVTGKLEVLNALEHIKAHIVQTFDLPLA
jgi:gamma-glutamyl:cysteine ligase YbdK (ATP-grasp superfamily)